MSLLNISLSEELSLELNDVATQLQRTPEECMQLALQYFLQTPSLDNIIEGTSRAKETSPLLDFPQLKEEVGVEVQFHPMAMNELEALTEEEQITILDAIMTCISDDEEALEESLELVLEEKGDSQLVLSQFGFGEIIYEMGETIKIYHIALFEDENEEEMEEEE